MFIELLWVFVLLLIFKDFSTSLHKQIYYACVFTKEIIKIIKFIFYDILLLFYSLI